MKTTLEVRLSEGVELAVSYEKPPGYHYGSPTAMATGILEAECLYCDTVVAFKVPSIRSSIWPQDTRWIDLPEEHALPVEDLAKMLTNVIRTRP